MSLLRDLWPVFRESDWRPSALARRLFGTEERDIRTLCGMMMDSDGDYSSLVIAERILDTYERLDHAARLDFYTFLNLDFDLDPELVAEKARDYAGEPSPETLRALTRAAEPRRQELLRRLNLSAGGTRRLVQMRGQLLGAVREFPDLGRLDVDFRHLFSSWFNRGF
ncbi:MAG: malonyl-CoA decarboxylase N-terminal domain-containing protein, partial [Gammaproteobacteria bacterium]|nr:malonyl-CoA decarboxylase N-terminal domain-containing protein [Gammaproteobacteria bacterium]